MTAVGTRRADRGAATVERLIEATAQILQNEGSAAVSVQHVANAAGTSKGLVHYHFADKDELLAMCAKRLTARLVDDERAALERSSSGTAVPDLWALLSDGGYRGRRRALLAIATSRSDATSLVLDECESSRRHAAQASVATLERLFDFQLPVSRAAVAIAFMAFADGLALSPSGRVDAVHRSAHDAFWLAVLSLTGA